MAAQHPDITRLISVGKSLQGRDIWAMRITDHPDENEPDEKGMVVFANIHAREHLTLEQALYLIHDLVDGYGVEGEATNLIDHRDIWVLPNVNPDGTEYDIDQWQPGFPAYWRKNRRQNSNGTIGVDLNRNFGYNWGWDNYGSSPTPGSETYRGPAGFSEPETQVLRDFAIAHPDLTVSISLHTYGELVLWPYGYTYTDIPPDMKAQDHAIFQAMSLSMANRNGYTPEQASELYLVNGDSDDWLYGVRGIYAVTFEMYSAGSYPGFYPPDSVIQPQTARNRTAFRYAIGLADDPAKSIGQGADMNPPQIDILSPQAADLLVESQPISATVVVTDNVGVTTVEYCARWGAGCSAYCARFRCHTLSAGGRTHAYRPCFRRRPLVHVERPRFPYCGS